MQTDLLGRLNNIHLARTKALVPLFECVINSMQAIEQSIVAKPGRVDINIRRETRNPELNPSSVPEPIAGFAVSDDGVGFNAANQKSFETSDTTYKREIGGKGIGRLLWLKAFDEVSVKSVFFDGIEKKRRSFMFRRTEAGIEEQKVARAEQTAPVQTTVELIRMLEPYKGECPSKADVIAHRLIEHLLVKFLAPRGPEVFLHDEATGEHIDLRAMFREEIQGGIAKEVIKVGGHSFTCHIARLYSAEETRHRFFLCAHDREVTAENLQAHIPDLTRKLADDERDGFVVLAYVTGEYLDRRVNQERTAIAFAEEVDLTGDITRQQLVDGIVGVVRRYVDPLLTTVRQEKRAQIEQYVATTAPEYKPLLKDKHAAMIDEIPPYLSPEKLDAELHRRAFRIEQSIRERVGEIKSEKIPETAAQLEELKERYVHLIDEENELGKAKLARYVVHRKTILDLFERTLALQPAGGYALEESIHEIICPLQTVSEDVPFEKLNLWIIDERLAFHQYLASDKALGTIDAAELEGKKRPDLLIFNRPIAFVDSSPPFQSIVIVEFKRPMRESYEKKDPITQVYEYCELISEGEAIDRHGRPIPVKDVPFYAYVVCDITAEIRAACRKFVMTETPDGMGYFGYNPHFKCYVEVMSFTKVLENSKRRNRVFFEHLGLPAAG